MSKKKYIICLIINVLKRYKFGYYLISSNMRGDSLLVFLPQTKTILEYLFTICIESALEIKTRQGSPVCSRPFPIQLNQQAKSIRSSIITLTFEPNIQFKILQDLERSKPVLNTLFYYWMRYLLPFGLGSAINIEEEKDNEATVLMKKL